MRHIRNRSGPLRAPGPRLQPQPGQPYTTIAHVVYGTNFREEAMNSGARVGGTHHV